MLTPAALILALSGLAASFSLAPGPIDTSGPDDELPVTAITLYRSGVGYFERHGLVDGDAAVQLTFDADQINDILKSMILLDLDGGRIESVGYGSREPIARRLASFGIDISDNPNMGELLDRLRGAPVRLGEVVVGPIRLTGVAASVNETPMDGSLLGLSFLGRLDSYEVRGGAPTLRQ